MVYIWWLWSSAWPGHQLCDQSPRLGPERRPPV